MSELHQNDAQRSSRPLLVEIKGVQFRNKGAYLMLLACLQGLKTLNNTELVLSPGPNLPYKERALLGAWQKLSFRRKGLDLTGALGKLPGALRRVLRRYGIVTERDVDVILEASGFAYGDQWPLQFLQNTAREVKRFHQAGKPFIFMPQAFGPFASAESQAAMRDIIQHAALVYVRDPVSLEHVKGCVDSLPDTVRLTPDFTIGLKGHSSSAFPLIDGPFAALIPNSKVVSKFNHANAEAQRTNYVEAFAAAANQLVELGYAVLLVNHEGEEDQRLCEEIARLAPCEIIRIEDPLAVKAFIGNASLVVSSRFHGAINALSQGVPCIATSWSHKYHAMMADFGMGDYCLEKLSAVSLTQKISQLMAEREQLSPVLASNAASLKHKNQTMWQGLYKTLDKYLAR
ncbi:polysaccharide pyruvyl transferase family protein [Rheinheimera sp.]|uniref:polysaccharide pyruvyl transferase family protein n=1 Tax=Rheinheimera sp. TaxID=1869214 RepID=UPI003AF73F9C